MEQATTARTRAAAASGVLALVLLLGGCSGNGVNSGDFNVLSVPEEWSLGRGLADELRKELQPVRDYSAQAYLDRTGRLLADTSELAEEVWEFHLLQEPTVQAFDIPGGHVYLSTGALSSTRDASELAAVLAHSIAHGLARHTTEKLSRAYGVTVLGDLAMKQKRETYRDILLQLSAGGSLSGHTLAEEREADRLAVQLLARTGFHPQGLVHWLERLEDLRQRDPGAVRDLVAAHPLSPERIEEVRQQVAALPVQGGWVRDEAGYRRTRQRLVGKVGGEPGGG
ncbi:MAG: M48 family metalloprotease [Acidobacteriota bacterium]|nr:M48 family metalloprotease [Acidobacteriota bacterium]